MDVEKKANAIGLDLHVLQTLVTRTLSSQLVIQRRPVHGLVPNATQMIAQSIPQTQHVLLIQTANGTLILPVAT